MAIDTSSVTEIEASPLKMAFLVVLGIGMTGVCLAIALGLIPDMPADTVMTYIAWFGAAFFGLALFAAIRNMLTMRGAVVTFSPEGIRDIRISKTTIPWSEVRDISTWSYRGQKMIVLKIDADTRKRLGLGLMARWAARINQMFGADGLSINPQGLKTSYRNLLRTCTDHWLRHGVAQAAHAKPGDGQPVPGTPGNDGLERFLNGHDDIPVSDTVEEVLSELLQHSFHIPLNEPPDEEGSMQLLVAKDNRELSWICLYSDEATLAERLPQGTPFVTMTFADAFDMLADKDAFAGISVQAGSARYLLPVDYFDRVRAVLGGGG
ncbi:MAG: STM3941 family protein [Pseudomonadota bacterium]|nr:STM3941 family protein [Pseudomonadota bacterium]